MGLVMQFIYVAAIILIGTIVLMLRRKAEGSRAGYKLILILLGILAGLSTTGSKPLLHFDSVFIEGFAVALLIILMLELSIRMNPENITFTKKNISLFFTILLANLILLGIAAAFILQINLMSAMLFAIIMSSVEYFLVDYLKAEGDLANPLLIFFTFSIMVFYSLQDTTFNNALYFIKYLLIGLGMGILVGIIVFKSLKKHVITPGHEIGLIAVAIAVYIITEQLAGSGLFAVMILGIFFGNSYVRKTAQMHSFSPYIFKSLEMLIYLMIGLVIPIIFSGRLLLQALLIFIIYLVLRFIIIYLHYRHHSMQNKLLLTLAPKGMIVGIMILVLGAYGSIENILLNTMLIILAYSLIVGIIIEYLEQKKMLRLDRIFKVLLNIRYGRKKDLKKNRHIHT